MALKELGNAVRTTYLLEWVMDESLRLTVHKGTTKVERHHKFAKHLAFGAGGHLRSNNPADQVKAIVYNKLVTNAVALQNVADQTQALHILKSKGVNIRAVDLALYAPISPAIGRISGYWSQTQRACQRIWKPRNQHQRLGTNEGSASPGSVPRPCF